HKDPHHLASADVQDMNSVGGNCVENGIDLGEPYFGNVPLGQRARMVERVRHAYSSRISIMPRLNSLLSGLKPLLSNISCRSFAPIGLPLMPSCLRNFLKPAARIGWSFLPWRSISSASSRSSRSSADIGSLRRGRRLARPCSLALDRAAIVCSLVPS